MGVAGRLYQTSGTSALPPNDQSAIREKVETFDVFTSDNDPHGERDFVAFEHILTYKLVDRDLSSKLKLASKCC
jgi:hypothetical protein